MKKSATVCQCIPPVSGISPDVAVGQRPVRACQASAHAKTCVVVNSGEGGRSFLPRCSARNRGRDEPPGSPRPPVTSAAWTEFHVSSGDSRIGPESSLGHRPSRAKNASAQPRICEGSSGGACDDILTPRRSTSSRASVDPPESPPRPLHSARSTPSQFIPPPPGMAPEACVGQSPVCACQASAHSRICGIVKFWSLGL